MIAMQETRVWMHETSTLACNDNKNIVPALGRGVRKFTFGGLEPPVLKGSEYATVFSKDRSTPLWSPLFGIILCKLICHLVLSAVAVVTMVCE